MTKTSSKKKTESAKNTANVTDPSTWNFATKCLQAGWKPKIGEPRVLPIFQSTTYKLEAQDWRAARAPDFPIHDLQVRRR